MLGTFADHLSETMGSAVKDSVGVRGESAATLVSLLNEPGMSIKRLTSVLGISPPSGVEMVRRLESMRLVERGPGPDGRTRAIQLTPGGKQTARRILATRQQVVAGLLEQLPEHQQSTLHSAVVALLALMTTDRVTADHICRRCDEPVCPPESCPVENQLM